MDDTPFFMTMAGREREILQHGDFQKEAVRYNMFYDMAARACLSIHSRDNSCIVMKNKENAMWLWVDETAGVKSDETLKKLALRLKDEPIASLSAAPFTASSFALKYCGLTGRRYSIYMSSRAYYASSSLWQIKGSPVNNVPGRLVRPDKNMAPLLAGFFVGFHKEAFGLELNFHTQLKNATAFIQSGTLYCWQNHNDITAMGLLQPYAEKFARLNYIYVHPGYRRRAYGKALTAGLSAIAFQKRLWPVLYTGLDNKAANKMYASMGFIDSGQIDEIRFL